MLFSSVSFIFVFLPLAAAIYYLVPDRFRNSVMLVISLLFYAWCEPVYLCLLLLAIAFNFFCGRDLEDKLNNKQRAKRALVMGITVNLLVLGFFKYYGWLLGSINELFSMEIPYRVLPLPIGISFYTLQAMSYLIDIYRGETKAQKSLFRFALYMSLFPNVTMGPLVRYADIERQIENRTVNPAKMGQGAVLFVCGLGKKVLLANTMREIYMEVTAQQMGTFSVLTAWVGCVAFAFQIYFDFSGYSDMAVGLARMFGFDIGRNFYYPYTAKSVEEFWHRWHIALGAWFRDYVYIPLGGNRCDASVHICNILMVWILVGLWHGAKWSLLFWGLFFGVVLILEKYVWGERMARFPGSVQHMYLFLTVCIGWVFFFSTDMSYAMDYLGVMFGLGASALIDRQSLYLIITHWLVFILCILGSSMRGQDMLRTLTGVYQSRRVRQLASCVVYLLILMLSVAFLVTDGYVPFLYYKF